MRMCIFWVTTSDLERRSFRAGREVFVPLVIVVRGTTAVSGKNQKNGGKREHLHHNVTRPHTHR